MGRGGVAGSLPSSEIRVKFWTKKHVFQVPSEGVVHYEFLSPGSKVGSPQEEAFRIIEIRFGADTQELVDKRAMPSVVVFYVIGEASVDLTEDEETWRIEMRGDMSEALWGNVE